MVASTTALAITAKAMEEAVDHGHLFYNRSESDADETVIRNVDHERIEHGMYNRASYNGGNGGLETMRPTQQQEAAGREKHVARLAAQTERSQISRNAEMRASMNHGNPAVKATSRPGESKLCLSDNRARLPGSEPWDTNAGSFQSMPGIFLHRSSRAGQLRNPLQTSVTSSSRIDCLK